MWGMQELLQEEIWTKESYEDVALRENAICLWALQKVFPEPFSPVETSGRPHFFFHETLLLWKVQQIIPKQNWFE